ncbi:MAG: NifU family protein [candidate division Zixibacteria bacterium]|nr:NifU family protein [candidate division Zixibacteria bacterium]MCI0596183.1 NifU family protein [candidate division Zixibacteria bacterium]
MDTEIKITAHLDPYQPNVCRFEVDRPVYAEGSAYFDDRGKASESPLAEKLFALDGIEAMRITGNEVILTQSGWEEWKSLAPKVGEVIRAHLRSGVPAVSSEFVARRLPDEAVKTKIQVVFDSLINPAIANHGGYVRLIDVKDSRVFLEMGGGCQGCAMSMATLRYGIETAIRHEVPTVADILDVTDHASGTNPYYTQ